MLVGSLTSVFIRIDIYGLHFFVTISSLWGKIISSLWKRGQRDKPQVLFQDLVIIA